MPATDNDLENRSFVIGRPNQMHPRLDIFDFYHLDVGRGERDTAFPFHETMNVFSKYLVSNFFAKAIF